MTIEQVFQDKTIKAKAKVATIGKWLIDGELPADELVAYAETQNAVDKATCIEALEYATKAAPGIADESLLDFVTAALKDKEPRVKWESAKVVGHIAKQFPASLAPTIKDLLANAENPGTVVRWATAIALAEILKLKTDANKKLLPAVEALCAKEEDNAVVKKYQDGIRKAKK